VQDIVVVELLKGHCTKTHVNFLVTPILLLVLLLLVLLLFVLLLLLRPVRCIRLKKGVLLRAVSR
jgi:hypothetical protein